MAAFSAGVRSSGAGSQRVRATSPIPATSAITAYARVAAPMPRVTMLRVAPRANAGMSGSTYCGSFDWLNVRNNSGTITHEARSSGSRAAGSRRARHRSRARPTPARAGTIHGNAATGRIGR